MLYHIIKNDDGEQMSDDEVGEDDIQHFKDMTRLDTKDKDLL